MSTGTARRSKGRWLCSRPSSRSCSPSPGRRIHSSSSASEGTHEPARLSCWEIALAEFKMKHHNEFQALVSAFGEVPLQKDDFLERLKSESNAQNQNKTLHLFLERIWLSLQPFKELAQLAARADPSTATRFGVGGLFLFIQISLGLGYRDFIIETFSEITCYMAKWYHFEKRQLSLPDPSLAEVRAEVEGLKKQLPSLFLQMLKLAASMCIYTRRNGPGRIGDRLKARRAVWETELKSLKSTESTCKAYKEVMEGEAKLQKENVIILDWITKSQKPDHEELRIDLGVNDSYQYCGQWLFQTVQYAQWRCLQGGLKPVLWLKGTVGTGKTTLMCRTIDQLLDDQELEVRGDEQRIIYYYCRGSTDTTHCLRALVRQLARNPNGRSIAPCIRSKYNERSGDDSSDCRFSVDTCKELLESMIPDDPRKRVIIIIDALDECANRGDSLLDNLSALVKCRPHSVRLLLSSQPQVDVKSYFKNQGVLSIQVNASRTKDDMRFYIEKEVNRRAEKALQLKGILGADKKLQADIISALSERANGMFQWVKLRIGIFFPIPCLESPDSVSGNFSYIEADVDLVVDVQQELRNLLSANPEDLNETYQKLYKDDKNERRNKVKTYRVIMSAYKPLTVKEVAEAVSVTDDGRVLEHVHENYIRRRCHNFFVEKKHAFLEFAHESARTFLVSKEFHKDDFSDTANHQEMAKICLELMRRCDHPFWVNKEVYPAEWKRVADLDLRRRLKAITASPNDVRVPTIPEEEEGTCSNLGTLSGTRDFALYLLYYWTKHCQELSSQRKLGPELTSKLIDVLLEENSVFLRWWHVLWVPVKQEGIRAYLLKSQAAYCMDFSFGERTEFRGHVLPYPLHAACVWDFAECLEHRRFRDSPRVKESLSLRTSPLYVCCIFGSNQTLSKLLQYYDRSRKLILKPCANDKRHPECLPIFYAILEYHVETVKILLSFERDAVIKEGRWSSKQLSSLGSFANLMGIVKFRTHTRMVELLLQFEASQTGEHFPKWHGEKWVSELAQQPAKWGFSPLQRAAYVASAEFISVLLKAGARSSTSSVQPPPLELAVRTGSPFASEIVVQLLLHDPTAVPVPITDEVINWLACFSTEQAARTLLRYSPELARARTSRGETALKIAVSRGRILEDLEDPEAYAERVNVTKLLEEYQHLQLDGREIKPRPSAVHERSNGATRQPVRRQGVVPNPVRTVRRRSD